MRQLMEVIKALADENRVRILMALHGRELCVCQIIELLSLAPSTVSKHISILKHARLVQGRKEGRWVLYRLAEDEATDVARDAMKWVLKSIGKDRLIWDDQQRLVEILRIDREQLCAMRKAR